jgi:hypothetical protein
LEEFIIDLDRSKLEPTKELIRRIKDVLRAYPGQTPCKLKTRGETFAFDVSIEDTLSFERELAEVLEREATEMSVSDITDARKEALAEIRETAQRLEAAVAESGQPPQALAPEGQIAELSPASIERLKAAGEKLTETIDQAVMQALIDAYPRRLTRIELWGMLFAYKLDPQTGEAFLRDDDTNPDKTMWWSLKQGDDWTEMSQEAMSSQRAGTLLDHQPTSKFSKLLAGQERNFSPNYLRRKAIPRIESEISLPISSSNNQADPGFRLVVGREEMLTAQEGDRRGLRNRQKRLDYLAASAGYFAGEQDEPPTLPEYEETPAQTSHAEARRVLLREKKGANGEKAKPVEPMPWD